MTTIQAEDDSDWARWFMSETSGLFEDALEEIRRLEPRLPVMAFLPTDRNVPGVVQWQPNQIAKKVDGLKASALCAGWALWQMNPDDAVHQMLRGLVRPLAEALGIKVESRSDTWHNADWPRVAGELGLDASMNTSHGTSRYWDTRLRSETRERYAEAIEVLRRINVYRVLDPANAVPAGIHRQQHQSKASSTVNDATASFTVSDRRIQELAGQLEDAKTKLDTATEENDRWREAALKKKPRKKPAKERKEETTCCTCHSYSPNNARVQLHCLCEDEGVYETSRMIFTSAGEVDRGPITCGVCWHEFKLSTASRRGSGKERRPVFTEDAVADFEAIGQRTSSPWPAHEKRRSMRNAKAS